MYGIDCHNIGSGALICGNLVYDCVYSALIVGSSEGGTGTIANNTFEVEAGSRCVRLEAGCDGWTFKNNLYRGGSALIDEGANALNVVMETNGYDPTVTNQVVDLGGAGGDYTISTIATLDTTAITSDPQLTSDYYLSNTSMEDAGVWVAGVRLHDDLPAPLHPPIGAKCRRDFPGRRFGSGGGTLSWTGRASSAPSRRRWRLHSVVRSLVQRCRRSRSRCSGVPTAPSRRSPRQCSLAEPMRC